MADPPKRRSRPIGSIHRPVNAVGSGVIDTTATAAAGTVAEEPMDPERIRLVDGGDAFATSDAQLVVHEGQRNRK